MTTWYINHPLDMALQNLPDDASPQERLSVVWQAYEAATGDAIGNQPADEQREKVHQWIKGERLAGPPLGLLTKRPRPEAPVSADVRSKARSLTQFQCMACEPIINDDGTIPMVLHMPIKVPPWSAQSVGTRNKILVDAIREQLNKRKKREPWGASPVCMSIAAVLPRSPKYKKDPKDADNLVKGLLDALQGVLYVNDNQVQCLTSRRFEYAGDVGYYLVSARAVHSWESDVVYDDPADPQILSGTIHLPD